MCFMGFMVHIPKLDQNERVRFKVADCVVVPSRYEPFGLTVCEAWSAGKVVVVAWHFWHFGTWQSLGMSRDGHEREDISAVL